MDPHQHRKTRELGNSPDKDDERPPRKKTKNLTASPDKQDSDCELCVSCHSPVVTDRVECQWCKKWEHKVCAKLSDSEYTIYARRHSS